jgi:hypothetical protein
MKTTRILTGIGCVVLFIIVIKIFFSSRRPYYEFDKYKKTIDSPISARVTRIIEARNFFGAQFGADSSNYYAFTYQIERTPKQWLTNYPSDFIIPGDSVVKKANDDTFTVIRKSHVWRYILPKDSAFAK